MREVVQSLEVGATNPQPARRPRSPRPRRRLPILIAAALVIVSGTAVGWALVTSSARDTVAVQCEIQGSDSVIPAASGDPVADCAAEWQRDTGSAAPRLVAYDNGLGGITVLAADETPPSGFTRLGAGETQNVSMVEMQQWLDDYISGLNSGCFDSATAVQMTQDQLARLGMTEWTVHVLSASDAGRCVGGGILDAATATVSLRAMGDPSLLPGSSAAKLVAELRSITQDCSSLDATAKQVRSAASELGLSEDAHQYELTEVIDNSSQCTTIYENVGGTIFLILIGPPS
jgi:hypothetical protein